MALGNCAIGSLTDTIFPANQSPQDLEVQEKQRNQEVVPMANLDTCVDVLEVAEELAIDRPKPPIGK